MVCFNLVNLWPSAMSMHVKAIKTLNLISSKNFRYLLEVTEIDVEKGQREATHAGLK